MPKQKFNQSQLIKADLRGFNAKIGSITNNSSCMFAMLPMFKGDKERENIIKERIRILRKLIGNSIDAAKGVEYIPFPSEWKKEEVILDTDSDDVKAKKRRKNSMRIKKKPYFMIYIYDTLKKQYMQYRKNNDFVCQVQFGCKLQQLIEKENKSDAEIKFLSRYNYFCPVLNTSCIMNMLCKRVEDLDFNFKYIKSKEEYKHEVYLSNEPFNSAIYSQVEMILNSLSRNYLSVAARLREDGDEAKRYGGTMEGFCRNSMSLLFDDCFQKLMEVVNNRHFIANYVIDIAYKKKSAHLLKTFAWVKFGRDIVKVLSEGKSSVQIPIAAEDGEDIFGLKVKLEKIYTDFTKCATFESEEVEDDDDDMFSAFEDLE